MEILNNDILIGDFRASDNGLIITSFSSGSYKENELGMNISTIEEYIGNNPVPKYLGHKYDSKLTPQVTFIKNPCLYKGNDTFFSEKECRSILRRLTGFNGYKWMKLISDKIDDDIWYRVKVVNVTYCNIGDSVVGIELSMECDSCFAWSREFFITINALANKEFCIFNDTDDLNNYVLPIVSISTNEDITLTNISDNSWETTLSNISEGEIITMDSNKELLSSSIESHIHLLNDFNLHWVRLVPEKNIFVSDKDANITFKYRVPRKVGII